MNYMVSELKAHLSAALRSVRQGEEVIVYERDIPVAKIISVDDLPRHSIQKAEKPFCRIASSLCVDFDPVSGLMAERARR